MLVSVSVVHGARSRILRAVTRGQKIALKTPYGIFSATLKFSISVGK